MSPKFQGSLHLVTHYNPGLSRTFGPESSLGYYLNFRNPDFPGDGELPYRDEHYHGLLTSYLNNATIRNMSNYHNQITHYAGQFKALSNPHRLALFRRLTSCCSPGTACSTEEAARLTVGQIGEGLDIAPSTISHHMKELNRAGLIQTERRGKQVECWVEPQTLRRLASFFSEPILSNTPMENNYE